MAQRKKNAKKKKKRNVHTTSKKLTKKTVKNATKKSNKKTTSGSKSGKKGKEKSVSSLKKKFLKKDFPLKKEKVEKTDLKKLPTLEKEEQEVKQSKKRNPLLIASIICLLLAILLMIPYGVTNYQSEASEKILDVPKFIKLKEECCNYSATFSTLRSAWSLKHDLKKIISEYQILECDGKTYYYNAEKDYTITEYGVRNGVIFNQVYITYGIGNSCDIDTTFKKLELLADDFSLEDAKKDGNYVIDGKKIYNQDAYTTFMENIENNILSTLRIVKTTKDGDVVITDLEYLSEGKYKVTYDGTRDRNSKDHNSIIAYKYEKIGIYKNKLYAFNGSKLTSNLIKTENAYYLFDIPEA